MAETLAKGRLLCRFHMRGFCRDRNSCSFSHDEHNSLVVPDSVCWYNLQGHCHYAANCRFGHLDAEEVCSLVEGGIGGAGVEDNSGPDFSFSTGASNSTAVKNTQRIEVRNLTSHNNSNRVVAPFNDPTRKSSSRNYRDRLNDDDEIDGIASNEEDSGPESFASIPSSFKSSHERSKRVPHTFNKSPNSVNHSSSNSSCSSSNNSSSSSKSYAQVCKDKDEMKSIECEARMKDPLCPYGMVNECMDVRCKYLHGDRCDLCNLLCLHPFNEAQRSEHRDECVKEHEKQMELSFAIQRSIDKACGVCMDNIMEKEPQSERRFGILEKCSHIFCLSCIRKWRQTKQFDNKTIRACPECRVSSDFVVPSRHWVDDKDEKDKLINNYKHALKQKACKYFKEGRGECPFAGACFYKHAYPDGRVADMPPPRQRRRPVTEGGELDTLRDMLLWNYLEVREDRGSQWMLALDLEDVFDMHDFAIFSETDDDSDFSDFDNLMLEV